MSDQERGPTGSDSRDSARSSDRNSDEGDTLDSSAPTSAVRQWPRRRQLLAAVVLVLFASAAALLLFVPTDVLVLLVDGGATFESSRAAPADETVSEYDYGLVSNVEFVMEEEVSVVGQSRTIVAGNQRVTYEHDSVGDTASLTAGEFTVVSTPAIEMGGEARNPIAGRSHRSILLHYSGEVGAPSGASGYENAGEHSVRLLGESVTVSEFETVVTTNGEALSLTVYVATTRSDGDVVVAVGRHPSGFPNERAAVLELMAAVEHPAE